MAWDGLSFIEIRPMEECYIISDACSTTLLLAHKIRKFAHWSSHIFHSSVCGSTSALASRSLECGQLIPAQLIQLLCREVAGRSRQGAPERWTPKDAVEHATVVYARNAARLLGSIGLIAAHSKSLSS